MRERLLVLAKAYPVVSSKYQELVCIAGITTEGELRRIYPVPWAAFWYNKGFKKKTWIEYEVIGRNPQDVRKESIKIDPNSITNHEEAGFDEIKRLIKPYVNTAEAHIADFKSDRSSLGFVKPVVVDFVKEERINKRMEQMRPQTTLYGKSAVRIDLIPEQLKYVYKCTESEKEPHSHTCEDWELGALYRHYLPDTDMAFEKCKERFMKIAQKEDLHFMLGTHHRWKTPMIIAVIYPRKEEEVD